VRVEVKSVTRVFGDVRAVDGASFSFGSGEVYGFIGPNGAGKTTTLRILGTLDVPTSGDAFIDGRSVVHYPDKVRRAIGFMPDSLDAYKDVTVTEYVDFFARAYGLRGEEKRRRVSQVMSFTDLEVLKDKLTDSLSKGMKQRLSLARALINDPQVLLLDEPAAGLDPRARVELRELIRALGEQGKAILVSSHILTELSEMCDGVVIIERGHILAEGKVCEVEKLLRARQKLSIELVPSQEACEQKGIEQLERFLVEQPGVSDVGAVGGATECGFDGTPGERAELLARIVASGFKVAQFKVEESDLEDIFLQITRGEVS
jgi:ABC-2 type transport system ATP-binding protein